MRKLRRRTDQGSASTELVVLTPLLVVLISLCFIGGRVVLARDEIDDIARTAAEAASVGGSPAQASYAATLTAVANVLSDGIPCTSLAIAPDTAEFGPDGTVSVEVTCALPLSHLAFAGLPGSVDLTATRTALIEPYRQLAT